MMFVVMDVSTKSTHVIKIQLCRNGMIILAALVLTKCPVFVCAVC